MILAVTHAEDVHAPPVLQALRRMGIRTRILDLAAVPRQVRLTVSAGRPARGAIFTGLGDEPLELSEVAAVWWRRPRPYAPDGALAPPLAEYAVAQVHAAVSGAWGALQAGWLNDPWLDERATHKPAQLAAAEAAGLLVPPTVITCEPQEARAFLEEQGEAPVVQKALRTSEASWRPTRLLSARDRLRLDDLRFAPVILQRYLPGVDVRVTVAGDRLHATEIDARGTASPHDFRPAYAQAAVRPYDLPEDVAAAVLAAVRALGLRYAAVDLRRTDDGRHWFLESNPAGQWLFLEERTGQPISQAVAEALVDAAAEARAARPAPGVVPLPRQRRPAC